MPHPRPPHLQRHVSRHGKAVWYVRRGHGPKIRVKGVYGTPEFLAAYTAALTALLPAPKITARKGTLKWLWEVYRQSNDWAVLKPATRRQRENIMLHVLEAGGGAPLSTIDKPAILRSIDKRAKTPSQAKNFLSTMRSMFEWAVASGNAPSDPTISVKVKKAKTEGFPVWTDEDIARFEERWPLGTRERVIFDVYCYTGLRRGDAAVVGKQHVSNGVISLQTEKTGTWVHIPLLPALQRTLDAGPTGETFIVTPKGNPYVKEALGNAFRDACRAAGIRKSAHGLRKAAATRAANNGATEKQLEAIFGWTGGQMAALYTRTANRRTLAADAMSKLDKAMPPPSENPAPTTIKP